MSVRACVCVYVRTRVRAHARPSAGGIGREWLGAAGKGGNRECAGRACGPVRVRGHELLHVRVRHRVVRREERVPFSTLLSTSHRSHRHSPPQSRAASFAASSAFREESAAEATSCSFLNSLFII